MVVEGAGGSGVSLIVKRLLPRVVGQFQPGRRASTVMAAGQHVEASRNPDATSTSRSRGCGDANARQRVMEKGMTGVILFLVVLLGALTDLVHAQSTAPEVNRVARVYLDAIKTSNLPAARDAVTPRMMSWTERFMRVVFDYKIIRDEPVCADTADFAAIRDAAATYRARAVFLAESPPSEKFEERRKALDDMKGAGTSVSQSSPCLARLLPIGGHGLFTDEMLTKSGPITTELHRVLVDVETPGRAGAKMAERRQLSLGRISVGGLVNGWKVINFGVLQ